MEAEHTALLYCCETQWLSRGKVLRGVFQLKEAAIFLSDRNKNHVIILCYSEAFVRKLACLVDGFLN